MIGQLVARRKDVRGMLKQEKDAGRRAQLDIRQKAPKIIAPNPNPNPNPSLTLTLTPTLTIMPPNPNPNPNLTLTPALTLALTLNADPPPRQAPPPSRPRTVASSTRKAWSPSTRRT